MTMNHVLRLGTALLSLLALVAAPAAPAEPSPADAAPALLVIDVQDFYFPGGALPLHEPGVASANIAQLLARWRKRGWPVVHVGHEVAEGGGFHADVAPRDGETVVMKREVCAFQGTDLLSHLQDRGITELVICGMQTHMCVEAAVRAAHDLGFRCTLVGDACATRDLEYGGATVAAPDVHRATLATLDGAYARVVDAATLLGGE
jgi:nicotinamidase-related amidase